MVRLFYCFSKAYCTKLIWAYLKNFYCDFSKNVFPNDKRYLRTCYWTFWNFKTKQKNVWNIEKIDFLNLNECSYSPRIYIRSVWLFILQFEKCCYVMEVQWEFDCLFIDLAIWKVLLCYGSSVRVEFFCCVSMLLKIMFHERFTSNRANSFNTLHLRDLLS